MFGYMQNFYLPPGNPQMVRPTKLLWEIEGLSAAPPPCSGKEKEVLLLCFVLMLDI